MQKETENKELGEKTIENIENMLHSNELNKIITQVFNKKELILFNELMNKVKIIINFNF